MASQQTVPAKSSGASVGGSQNTPDTYPHQLPSHTEILVHLCMGGAKCMKQIQGPKSEMLGRWVIVQ